MYASTIRGNATMCPNTHAYILSSYVTSNQSHPTRCIGASASTEGATAIA
jgi:hypothetical protein